jgi:hypothetical protein
MIAEIDKPRIFSYHCLMAETVQPLTPIVIGAAQGVRVIGRVIGINPWG